MNQTLYQERLDEIIVDAGRINREINDELVEVQIEIVKTMLDSCIKSLTTDKLADRDIIEKMMVEALCKQMKELSDYTKQAGISKTLIDEAARTLKMCKNTLEEKGLYVSNKNDRSMQFDSSINYIRTIVKGISDHINTSESISFDSLDSQYDRIKPKLEEAYKMQQGLKGDSALKSKGTLENLVRDIKAIKEEIDKLKKSIKEVDKSKILELHELKQTLSNIVSIKLDDTNIKEALAKSIECTNKLNDIIAYAEKLGKAKKDSIHVHEYESRANKGTTVWFESKQNRFIVSASQSLDKAIYIERKINMKLNGGKLSARNTAIDRARTEVNCLKVFDDTVISVAAHGAKVTKTSSLMNCRELGISDYYIKQIEEELKKKGQQRITYGVFCRSYITKYIKDVYKYDMDIKSEILKQYLDGLYNRLGIVNDAI